MQQGQVGGEFTKQLLAGMQRAAHRLVGAAQRSLGRGTVQHTSAVLIQDAPLTLAPRNCTMWGWLIFHIIRTSCTRPEGV